jgi:hypothetical protein
MDIHIRIVFDLPSSPFAGLTYVTQGIEKRYAKMAVRARAYVSAVQMNVFKKNFYVKFVPLNVSNNKLSNLQYITITTII